MADEIEVPKKSSWLSINITYLISFWLLALWSAITIAIIYACIKALLDGKPLGDLTVVMAIYAAVSGRASTPVDFFLGSSKGSADKQVTLDKMTTPTPTPGVVTTNVKTDIVADPLKP